MSDTKETNPSIGNSPAGVVAMLVAAKKAGDRTLERWAKAELRRRYKISVTFHRN